MTDQEKVTRLEFLRTHTVTQIVDDSRLVMAGEMILDLCEELLRLEQENAQLRHIAATAILTVGKS